MKRFGLASVLVAMSFSVWGMELPYETMPDRVYKTLNDAMTAYYAGGETNREWPLNRAGLEELHTKMLFPDYSQLQFLQLHHRQDTTLVLTAWGKQFNDNVRLIMDDWVEESFSIQYFSEVQIGNCTDEIRQVKNSLKDQNNRLKENPYACRTFQRNPSLPLIMDDRIWIFWKHLQCPEPRITDLLFQWAYVSAYWEESEVTGLCLQIILRIEPSYFDRFFDRTAARAVDRGKTLLVMGNPLREIYERWMAVKKVYGESQVKNELNSLLDDMKPQVQSENVKIDNPQTLPLNEQINYYIDQLQDTRESAPCHPPFYLLLQKCDPLIKMGTPAIDQLIDHLDDGRLTRTVYEDDFYLGQVFRVYNVVNACISKILDFRPDTGENPVFPNKMFFVPEERKQKMKEWWALYRTKSPVEWYKSQLAKTPIGNRIELLKKIEAIDPIAVDSINLLKQWAAELDDTIEREQAEYKARIETEAAVPPMAKSILLDSKRRWDTERLPQLANALAERGDFSLLPKIRACLQDGLENKTYLYHYVGYLIRYGTVDDCRNLYQLVQQEARQGYVPGSSKMIGPVFAAVESATRPLTVPFLVSFLDRTEESGVGSDWSGNGQYSMADRSMEILVRRIQHEEGFRKSDPMPVRREAIERWKQWWEREGKSEFVKKHPETIPIWKE